MSIAILGTKTTAVRLIEALGERVSVVVTVDDGHDGRSRTHDIVDAAARVGAPAVIAADHRSAYAALRQHAPSVVFVAGWYWIIPAGLLEQFKHGFIGVHYSRLPAYRGSAPAVWQMLNGEPEVGYSVFRFTEGMDEGPIAASGAVPIGPRDTIATILDALDAASLPTLVGVADAITSGTARFEPQPETGLSYAGVRTPADGLIDWTRPANELERFVRAQTRPYPGAYTVLDGDLVRIWAAHADVGVDYFGQPGQLVRMVDGSPVVATGRGGLVLDDIESAASVKFSLARTRFALEVD